VGLVEPVVGRERVRAELLAGLTTFLTMSYIVFVQPAVLSGSMFGTPTGMDFGAVTTATCLAAAVATALMGLYARYPIALAPGMGQNFFFVFTAIPVAAAAGSVEPWRAAMGAVFWAGVLFVLISIVGIRQKVIDAMSASMKVALAVGIGFFIAFIGLKNAAIVVADPGTAVRLNGRIVSADVLVFALGFVTAAVCHARQVRGAVLWGIAASLGAALLLHAGVTAFHAQDTTFFAGSRLVTDFRPARALVGVPSSLSPTLLRMDLSAALSAAMIPVVIMFLFMDVFDTTGTLIGLGKQAGFLVDNKLPRAEKAMLADAVGTVVGAAAGTSTVTSYIESAAGIEAGGRTWLTAITVAALFLLALFFAPVIGMVGSYPPITAPALVLVGAMMARSVVEIPWRDYTEAIPAFLVILGIPLTHSIADGLSLGLIAYPVLKLLAGRGRELGWITVALAVVLLAYFVLVRSRL
jgi:AGZA family xanthine/uracil permease-like MFS transporter